MLDLLRGKQMLLNDLMQRQSSRHAYMLAWDQHPLQIASSSTQYAAVMKEN